MEGRGQEGEVRRERQPRHDSSRFSWLNWPRLRQPERAASAGQIRGSAACGGQACSGGIRPGRRPRAPPPPTACAACRRCTRRTRGLRAPPAPAAAGGGPPPGPPAPRAGPCECARGAASVGATWGTEQRQRCSRAFACPHAQSGRSMEQAQLAHRRHEYSRSTSRPVICAGSALRGQHRAGQKRVGRQHRAYEHLSASAAKGRHTTLRSNTLNARAPGLGAVAQHLVRGGGLALQRGPADEDVPGVRSHLTCAPRQGKAGERQR